MNYIFKSVTKLVFLIFFSFLSLTTALAGAAIAQGGSHTVAVVDKNEYFEAVGVLVPRTVTTLSSKIMGNITSFTKREGEDVSSSEVLVTIDETELEADLAGLDATLAEIESGKLELEKNLSLVNASKEAASAAYNQAQSTYNRFKELNRAKTISTQEFEKIETEFKIASSKMNEVSAQAEVISAKREQLGAKRKQVLANIEKVKTNKKYARVTSPIDGRVTARLSEPGSLATPGTPLVTVEDYKNMLFQAVVPENIINTVKIGEQVKVIVDVIQDQTLFGQVAEIMPTGDIMTHTFIVKIALSYDSRLKSGMYARGLFFKEKIKSIMVPTEYIEKRGQLYFVKTGSGETRFVRPGESNGNLTEILSGLDSGEVIVKK